jgi:tetratricopeptide (TPR) repeat protein
MRFLYPATFLLLASSLALADRASAERLVAEGVRAASSADYMTAIERFGAAVQADPAWAVPYGHRGEMRMLKDDYAGAVEDYSRAIAIEPSTVRWYLLRSQSLMAMDHWGAARDDAETLLKLRPDMPEALCIRGWSLVNLGDVDGGLADQDKALEIGKGHPAFRVRFDAYFRKADWPALEAEAEAGIASGMKRGGLHFYRVVALVEQTKWDEAARAIEEARQPWAVGEPEMGLAWLAGTPASPRFDPSESLRALERTRQSKISFCINLPARTHYLADRPGDCWDHLATRGRRTNFDTVFWLAASSWKTGRLAEARTHLRDARRLNPYMMRHAERLGEFRDFAASIDREIAAESGAKLGEKSLEFELATHLLTVSEIEALVRRYRFASAAAEYGKLLTAVSSSLRRSEIETRLPEVRGMAGAHAKLVEGVSKGALKLKARVGKLELTLVRADEAAFEFTITGGSGKYPWAFLDPETYCDFALQASPTPEETLGLACLAWDAGRLDHAVKLFEDAVRRKPALKTGLTAFVARKRGEAAPQAGYVLHRGRYVTAHERANLDKGLVRWRGEWVTAKDRDQLARGLTKVGDAWVAGKEADLLRQGFRKYKDRWLSREEYEEVRSRWEDAWIEETEHCTVKTNHSETFAKDLALLAETAWEKMKAYHGGAEPSFPPGARMTLHAYRSFEDYRDWCVQNKAQDQVAAAGFARSDLDVAAGWNKTGNDRQFLQTMIHEASHLFYFRVSPAARPPSWYAEGMATWFEGFAWDGAAWTFSHISDARLPFARDAMKAGRHIPLKELLAGDAMQLILADPSRALLFYAECWSLHYYLSRTDDRSARTAWAEFRKAADSGTPRPLLDYFPDPARIEKDWISFISGM